MQGDVERLLEVGAAGEVVPAERPRRQQQVAARRDRQELGEALDDAQDDGVQDWHAGFLVSA